MKQSAQRIDLATVHSATYFAVSVAENMQKKLQKFLDDPDKEKRLKEHVCKTCHYLMGRIGGAAMTTRPCGHCGKDMLFGSTCTDVLCEECAKELRLCKHCGGDIDMKRRRKL